MARNGVKCVVDEIEFDSKTESRRYLYLKELLRVGEISDLKLQIKYELIPAHVLDGKKVREWNYISDFEYFDEVNGIYIIEDVKGFPEPADKYKKKMFEWINRGAINSRQIKFIWTSEAPKYHIKNGGDAWVEYKELAKIRRKHKNG